MYYEKEERKEKYAIGKQSPVQLGLEVFPSIPICLKLTIENCLYAKYIGDLMAELTKFTGIGLSSSVVVTMKRHLGSYDIWQHAAQA